MEYPISYLETFSGYTLFHTKEIDSTNSYFKREKDHFKGDSILLADHQTAGRGREIRKWEDNKEDLLFSLFSKEDLRFEILMPLAILRATRRHHATSFIKWPNDLYVEDKKLCGILIEKSYEKSSFHSQVIGVGINFSKKENLPSIGMRAFDKNIGKLDFLKEILSSLDELKKMPLEEVLDQYKKNNLIYNRRVFYHCEQYKVDGFTIEGYLVLKKIDQEKTLIVKSDEIDIKACIEGKL